MKSHGCLALAVLLCSGCATTLERDVHAPACAANRQVPRPSPPETVADPGPRAEKPAAVAEPTPPLPPPAEEPAKTPPPVPADAALPDPTPVPVEAAPDPVPEPEPVATPDPESKPDQAVVVAEKPPAEAVLPSSEPVAPAEEIEKASAIVPKEAPPDPKPGARPRGRPVASVGDEIITLPELTEAVKDRLETLGPGRTPGRRQMIAVARSILKGMIVRSLVFQEAEAKLGGPSGLAEARARLLREWDERERPALYRRERVTTEAEFAAKLAKTYTTPDAVREEFLVRSLGAELARRERSTESFESYLDGLRKRRPVTSIMTPSELAAAGRQAAGDRAPGPDPDPSPIVR